MMTPVKSVQTLQFRGENREHGANSLWFAPYIFVFSQNMSDGYMSRHIRGIYNQTGIYFVQVRKGVA